MIASLAIMALSAAAAPSAQPAVGCNSQPGRAIGCYKANGHIDAAHHAEKKAQRHTARLVVCNPDSSKARGCVSNPARTTAAQLASAGEAKRALD